MLTILAAIGNSLALASLQPRRQFCPLNVRRHTTCEISGARLLGTEIHEKFKFRSHWYCFQQVTCSSTND
jgi:hypothetical protein